jgi:hypothetical protein
MRDSRVELFVDNMYPGLYKYAYLLCPNNFLLSPFFSASLTPSIPSYEKYLIKFSYVVRAMTKGSFLVPPAKAEEMYSPDVYLAHSSPPSCSPTPPFLHGVFFFF